jgi:GNAT superfamily N-acetyltransferase/catechol 2,3-dioxygenase-like lactoylglutathione lyase family enzyme
MTVTGLFETHLTVADLPRSVAFYRDIVGLPVAHEVPERGATFHWIGRPGQAMLGLWEQGSSPPSVRLHVAFALPLIEVHAALARLRALGVQPLSFDGEPTDEPSVIDWMPAVAVYFRDPDGHLLEYIAMLDSGEEPPPVHVEPHAGPRAPLRALFALAEDSASQIDAYIDDGLVLVAISDGEVVGHLQLTERSRPDELEIKNMAVTPSRRRRGVGSALIDAAVTQGRAEARSRLLVATAAADLDNLRFYQRLGFRMRAIERDAFAPEAGYEAGTVIDGIELRDRVWLDRPLTADG